jgi:hypothetical protein
MTFRVRIFSKVPVANVILDTITDNLGAISQTKAK